MSQTKRTLAVVLSAVLVLGVAAPALAGTVAADDATLSVSVAQEDGDATVTVTRTGNNTTSAVSGANVTVETLDENASYDGAGTYTTGENGTVTLPAPNETVNVSVSATAGNLSDATTTTLAAESDDGNASNFGQRVSSFVASLQSTNNTSDAPLGVLVASFVVANNPGDPPDHAGPPEWLVNDSVNKTTGPPEDAGPPENKSGGPPDDAGPPNGSDGGPPDDAGSSNSSDDGGPPDDKGNDGDAGDDSDESNGNDGGNGNNGGNGPPEDKGNDGDDDEDEEDDSDDDDSDDDSDE